MSNVVHLLWFAKEMPDGEDDIELLIGVYSSNGEASAAIQRMKDKPGFADFPQGFKVCPYSLDGDHWTEGFVAGRKTNVASMAGLVARREEGKWVRSQRVLSLLTRAMMAHKGVSIGRRLEGR